ncbi:MAG: hypothetical protein V1721_09750 [Pseudomonadota bacterium]
MAIIKKNLSRSLFSGKLKAHMLHQRKQQLYQKGQRICGHAYDHAANLKKGIKGAQLPSPINQAHLPLPAPGLNRLGADAASALTVFEKIFYHVYDARHRTPSADNPPPDAKLRLHSTLIFQIKQIYFARKNICKPLVHMQVYW